LLTRERYEVAMADGTRHVYVRCNRGTDTGVLYEYAGRFQRLIYLLLSVASADDDGVVVGGDVLRVESSPADR
jgi:hypothetical protein